MVNRELTNSGSPIVDGEGNPVAGAVVSFQLVDIRIKPADSFMSTGERVSAQKVATATDADGVFSIVLACTSDMVERRFWLCRVEGKSEDLQEFAAILPSGDSALQFADFKAGA